MRQLRRPSRQVSVLLVALVGGLLVAVPRPPRRARRSRKLSKEIDVTVGPAGQRKVCTVVFDLYRPSTATRTHRKPAILTTNGFGGSKDDQADLGRAFARRGYVVLSYSGLGFGGSDCKITLDDPDWDGLAAKQLVTYLGGGKRANDGTKIRYVRRDRVSHDGVSRRHDPRVGMVGGSYGGQVQFAVAGIDPRVDTIVPIITWNDLSYSLAPNNTDFERGRHLPDAGHREGRLDQPLLRGRHRRRHRARRRPTRPATPAARTSPTRPAWPRRRWTRSATRRRTPWTSPGTPA